MSKKNFIEDCYAAASCTMAHSRNELNLFCEIMGLPKSNVNYFIGNDPHGVVDIMEGYHCFNMTDIYVVISEYERWMSIYKTNEELRKAVDAWYYYCQEWYEKHSYEEPQWVSVGDRLPEKRATFDTSSIFVYARVAEPCYLPFVARYNYNQKEWRDVDGVTSDVCYWKPIITPEQEAKRSKGCPNLRSWLAGCPVDGLREATPEWKEEQRKAKEAAHQRVEEAKQALEDAIKEEVKLNKF